ncbi:MAG: carbohydrate ABC transporter permease, partial [Rectinema sp.]
MKHKRVFTQQITPFWYILLALFLLFALFPIYWMLVTSLKSFGEIYNITPTLWPKKFAWSNYVAIFKDYTFGPALINSFKVSLVVSFLTVFVSVVSAYAVSRLPIRGRKIIPNIFLVTYLIPSTVLFIPIFIFLSRIGLSDNLNGLLLVYPTMTIPYATWVMITFFKSLPIEMEEAAAIDGASRMQTLTKVVLPVSFPTIVSTLIFSFTICWSEYIYALVIINQKMQRTITVALSATIVADIIPWGPLMAGAFISTIPVLVFYLFASRYII